MNDLKPCPFCGGEATVRYEPSFDVYYIHCDTCNAETGNTGLYKNEGKAIEAWNTRAERTCHVVKNSRKYVLSDGTELFDDGCSICNGYIGAGENYCSNCGAKVVEK